MALNILSQKLAAVRRARRLRRAVSLTGLALLPSGGLRCILNAWDYFFGLQESAAALWTAAGALLFPAMLCLLWYFRLFRKASDGLPEMAKAVEKGHPEFQDAYFAAVELEARTGELRPMEAGLLRRMQEEHGARPGFPEDVFAAELSWRSPLAVLFLSLALWTVSAGSGRVLPKAFHCWHSGSDSGLYFHEYQKEYPVHSDVRIAVDILRWEKRAHIEIRDARGEKQILPMTDSKTGTSVFTFYDFSEDCSFRIATPSLRSSWRKIHAYVPPAAEQIRLTVAPPAYTRLKSRTWTALRDLEAVAGSLLILQVQARENVSAELRSGGRSLPADSSSDKTFRTEIRKDGEFELVLSDCEGHSAASPSFRVTVIPDMPPVVELREPEPDAKVRRGDSLRLSFMAGDDFGVSRARLRFSVSGSRKQVIGLFQAAPGKENTEEEVVWRWDLPRYQVKDGDLLSCFIEVADNRSPEPQWTRSDLFFLTVRPHEDFLEEDQKQGMDSGQKFDVSALIAENKRLLRLSLDSMGAELQDRKRNRFELHRSLNELALEVIRKMNEMIRMSQGRPQPGLVELFKFSSDELKKAARLVDGMLFEESLQPEEASLTALVRLENELIKNSMRKKQGSGQQENGKEQQQNQEQVQQQEQPRQSLREQLEKMRKMLSELRKLSQDQQKLAERCGRQAELPEKLAREQSRIRERTAGLEAELRKMPPAARSAGHLAGAEQEMRQGAQAMQEGRASAGEIHAVRAGRSLEQAVRSLESAVRKASANQVEQLAEAAGQLADRQRREARRSSEAAGRPTPSEARESRNRQKQLGAMTRALKQEIQETAAMLEKDFPEAAAEMRKQSAESSRRGLEKAQKRAENGLLYRRFESAGKSQQEAANLLQGLAQGLHESAGRMPPVSADELRDALEQLQRSADQIAGEMSESGSRARQRIQQQRGESGEMLQRLGESLRDSGLMELSGMLKAGSSEGSPEQAGRQGLELLKASADIILQHLRKLERGEKLRLNRSRLLPPEKYRRQVQEYFKNLGEEQ